MIQGNANIRRINGVQPSEFVLNNMNEAQKIYGEKYFAEDLVVEGEVIAPQINDTNIIREYEDGVRNDNEYVDIFGDLVSILEKSFNFTPVYIYTYTYMYIAQLSLDDSPDLQVGR